MVIDIPAGNRKTANLFYSVVLYMGLASIELKNETRLRADL